MNNFKNTVKANFTAIPNVAVEDDRLSWKAKGIFLYLASKPNDWQFYMNEIKKNATDGKTSLQTGIKELEKYGYLNRTKATDKDNKFVGWNWELLIPRQSEIPTGGNPDNRETPSYTNTNYTNKEYTNKHIDYVQFVDLWNDVNDCNLRITDKKREQIRARLRTYSEDELKTSIRNRSKDDWINGEGKKYKDNWDSFWRNDEKPERYLNVSNNSNGIIDGGTW